MVFLESNLEAQEIPDSIEWNYLEINSEGRSKSTNTKQKEFWRQEIKKMENSLPKSQARLI